MNMNEIKDGIRALAMGAMSAQSSDGSWRLCLDTGISTDCYWIVLLTALRRRDDAFIRPLAARIASLQQPNGAWKLYPDEEGSLEATAEACYALLCAGFYLETDGAIERAKQYIRSKGGLSQAKSLLTQVIFSATGQAEWPKQLRLPLELFFSQAGLDLFSLSGHARVHLIPTLVMSNLQFSARNEWMPDMGDLFVHGERTFANDHTWISALNVFLSAIPFDSLPVIGSPNALEQARQFMLERLEPNGTLLTYSTSTILMAFALMAMQEPVASPLMDRLLHGVLSLQCWNRAGIQTASSEIWDTAMISYALREAGLPTSETSTSLENAALYLASRQQFRVGDWIRRSPHTEPGGWGFSDVNTFYPDVDDSVAALRTIRPYLSRLPDGRASWQRGLNFVLAMRNDDGGWPAFERRGSSITDLFFTFDGKSDIASDPSTVDLSCRVLEFLGEELDMTIGHSWVDDSVKWVLSRQERDGSWYGRWGIAYVHGTGMALQGLLAVGLAKDHPAVTKGVRWLFDIQNSDGGWGESCVSDERKRYVPLNASTPSQTAWALNGLIAAHDKPTSEMERGVEALLRVLRAGDWTSVYPTGAMLPGSMYAHYPSNNVSWPLLALSAYVNKFDE
ncbi:squalene cyclase [Paenibacillus agaridevorans]|uniref:Squalene cyclase n=1 Tax=Paenibacillus agaridevorans TaxID=171404 RepID=A0A2R5F3N3_9BACL|nr:prenyltransferase/squalene oxidase repeat-containing protein [Paenibacillus agaridevorans]GBG12368.1 squalene cyclase [Paenibacillus agaridevorans]